MQCIRNTAGPSVLYQVPAILCTEPHCRLIQQSRHVSLLHFMVTSSCIITHTRVLYTALKRDIKLQLTNSTQHTCSLFALFSTSTRCQTGKLSLTLPQQTAAARFLYSLDSDDGQWVGCKMDQFHQMTAQMVWHFNPFNFFSAQIIVHILFNRSFQHLWFLRGSQVSFLTISSTAHATAWLVTSLQQQSTASIFMYYYIYISLQC